MTNIPKGRSEVGNQRRARERVSRAERRTVMGLEEARASIVFDDRKTGAEVDAIFGAGSDAAGAARHQLGLLPVHVRIDVKTTSPNPKGRSWSKAAQHAEAARNKKEHAIARDTIALKTQNAIMRYPARIRLVRVAPSDGLDAHDNLRAALKFVVDGITEALDFKNDRDPNLLWEYDQRRGRRREYAIEVTIISVDA